MGMLGVLLPPRALQHDLTVLRDSSASPTDVQQGALGDCWLLSALALLAEKPSLLEALLPTRVANDAGAYHVRLCCDGEWRTLLVDDLLPCTAHGAPAFGSAARRQLWVPLVEKACAKVYGCYEALEGGTIEEALALLTGFPTERLSLQGSEQPSAYAAAADISSDGADRDVLWSRLLSAHEAGYLCGASCGAAGGGGRDAAAISAAAEAMGRGI